MSEPAVTTGCWPAGSHTASRAPAAARPDQDGPDAVTPCSDGPAPHGDPCLDLRAGAPGRLRVRVPGQPAAVPAARAAVVAWLGSAPGDQIVMHIRVVVTEIVTNAVLHAGGEIELVGERSDGAVTIEVTDGSGAPPVLEQAGELQEGGRGLRLVAMLADEWGYELRPAGKTVWARFHAPERCGA